MLSDESERELAGAVDRFVAAFGSATIDGRDGATDDARLVAEKYRWFRDKNPHWAFSDCQEFAVRWFANDVLRPLLASRDAAIAERDRRIAEMERRVSDMIMCSEIVHMVGEALGEPETAPMFYNDRIRSMRHKLEATANAGA